MRRVGGGGSSGGGCDACVGARKYWPAQAHYMVLLSHSNWLMFLYLCSLPGITVKKKLFEYHS